MSTSKCASEYNRSKKCNDYSLQFTRWFLKPIGAWPQINTSSSVCKIVILLHIFICSSMIASNMVPCLLYVLFEKVNIKLKLSAVGPLLHRVMGSVHYWVLLKRNSDIYKVIRHMETDWCLIQRLDNRELMLQQAKFGRFVAIICGIIMYGGTILFSIAKAMKTITIDVGNETFTTHPMTCPVYSKIIDTRFSPVNEIALVLQNLAILVVSSSTVGACSLAAVFAIHACGQLKVLNAWLHELVENQKKGNDTAERKLAAIVEHHLRILSFISQVESIMHKAALVELAGCTVVMCLLGYYTITAWETLDTTKITSSLIVYLSMGFNIFIFCYIGGIITEQCKNVGEMAYMTDWYNLHHKTARSLILIIARSNNVIKITAGKLFHLSIATFGDVSNTNIPFLSMVNKLYNFLVLY
ncbi:Odorant receptor Or2 [Trachymyrmex zeteki]|uniref:Odorant receptor n=1 Tax=Mycetomoellerius zeteki TaxID=64791 RepID=A0A151WJY4_9HYME|nr:Odorant receptor Or2 [Trachymyrmex zeteki]